MAFPYEGLPEAMRAVRAFLIRVLGLGGTSRRDRELDAEIDSHLQLHIDDNLRAGMTPDEARRAARLKFGPVEAIKEQYRERSSIPVAAVLLRDVRYAARRLRWQPAFTLVVVLTLALGVGANAVMFGLVDVLMLRTPDHVRDLEQLVNINRAPNYVRYLQLTERVRSLDLAAYTRQSLSFGRGADAIEVRAECVTPTFFPVLGTPPFMGRTFLPGEDALGRELTAVIAHSFWRRQFGGDPGVLGRSAAIAGRQYSIVGVAPRDFSGLEIGAVDVWILLAAAPEACSFTGTNLLRSDGGSWLRTIARVRDGYTLEQASADADAAGLEPDRVVRADGSIGAGDPTVRLDPIGTRIAARDGVWRQSRLALWLAGGAAALLLVACANVAGLLSTRAIERRREIAVRVQLGASRSRIFVQLLAENFFLGILCALVAVPIAAWIGSVLRAFLPLGAADALLNGRSLALLAAFAAIAGIASGVVPALQTSRADIVCHLRGGQAIADVRTRFRTAVVVLQVAVALVLAVGAGLFVRSVQHFRSDLAYDLDDVIVAAVDFKKAGYRRAADITAIYDEMFARVRQLPQVEAASLRSGSLLGAGGATRVSAVRRTANDVSTGFHASIAITPDYFATAGIRIVQGRAFTASDDTSAKPVVILNETLAERMFDKQDPIGKCVMIGGLLCREVVGVSELARRGVPGRSQAESELFVPLAQSLDGETAPQMLLVRPRASSAGAPAAIAAAVRSVSPDLPYVQVRSLGDLADVEARSWRMGATIFSLFGTLAVLLAAVGIYGTLAFSCRQRTAEIGVHMALGATPRDVVNLVLRQGLIMVAAGVAIGCAAAFSLTGAIRSLLFNVAPTDALTFSASAAVIVLAGIAGCCIPAYRAARTDPAVALRYY
jgi:putative ABC transport system permease protein